MIKNVYLVLIVLLLISFTSCKKASVSGNNSGNVTDTTKTTTLPSTASDGVTFVNSGKSVIFNLYAPGKTSVAVIGDFNGWTPTAMKKTTDGTRWWVQIDNLDPNTEYSYQYYIDGSLKVADPYSHKILDPNYDSAIPKTVYPNLKVYPTGKTTGIVSDFYANEPAYNWQVTTFTPPAQKNLVIYELLVRDFVATHSYQTLTDTLNYIARLGVNAIELLPINEFEANDSWGYNSNFMFALDKYYGTPNAYKAFIDACHARGIAVIQDIVLEDQFGSSPMVQMYATSTSPSAGPSANNPWFDQTNMHPDAVGWQLNHSLATTQYFSENVMKYWMQEYHIDGYRFDEAKGYTQVNSGNNETTWAAYDASRVTLWTQYNNYMKSINPNFYVILEMFSANQEEAQYASQGMMCWTNLSTPAEQATMGYNDAGGSWDLSGLFYDVYGFPSSGTSPYGLIAYFESHDQERLQFKNGAYGNNSGSYNIKTLATGLQRDEMGAAFMFSSPGPKMVWQGGELGYDVSIDATGDHTVDKPFNWTYNSDPNRLHLYGVYKKMINMKIKNPVFTTTNFHYSLAGAVKTIQLLDPTADVEIIGNFDVVANTATVTFPATGTWVDNLTGATYNVTSTSMSMTLAPGEYHVYSNVALKQ
jgi:1,4-alpha-glucan branching enzyme